MKHYIPEVKQVVGEDDPNSTVNPITNIILTVPTYDNMLDELDRLGQPRTAATFPTTQIKIIINVINCKTF